MDKLDIFKKRIVNQDGDIRERVIYQRHMADDIFAGASGVISEELETVASGILAEEFVLAAPASAIPNPHLIYSLDADVIPDASGNGNVGTVTTPWGAGVFDSLKATTEPSDTNDVATKYYVDHQVAGESIWIDGGTEIYTRGASDNVVPNASGTQQIGTRDKAFSVGVFDTLYSNDAYISGDSIYLGNAQITYDSSYGVVFPGDVRVSDSLTALNNVVVGNNAILSTLSIGSVLFLGAGNAVSENNANLYWDSANNRLGIGTSSPSVVLEVVGDVHIGGGNLNMSSGSITSVATPTIGTDAATKAYVDVWIGSSRDWKDAVTSFLDFTTAEPAVPTTGDRYINTVTGTSSVTAQSVTINNIYEWNGVDWTETVVTDAMTVKVTAEGKIYTYNSGDAEWKDIGGSEDHNSLIGLQGGTTNEYYHLTEAQRDNVFIKNVDDSDDINEGGTNLFYSTTRVDARVQSSDSDYTIQGDWAFNNLITCSSTPTEDNHLARKKYVDDLLNGFTWQDAVIDRDLSGPPVGPSIGDRYIVSGSAGSDWYNLTWLYRQKVTIDNTKVAGDEVHFPVLVSIESESNELFTNAQSTGYDILFVSGDGLTKIPHEIEYFNATAGSRKLDAWVKVPSLSSTVDTDIYMYYGNATCGDQQEVEDTWDSDYSMVMHLSETTGTHYDSTSNNNDGTCYGGVTQDAAGKIDGADTFDGGNDYIQLPSSNDITGDNLQKATFEAWVNLTDVGSQYIAALKRSSSQSSLIALVANYGGTDGKLGVLTRVFADNTHNDIGFDGSYNDGAWHQVVATIDDLTRTVYVDGASVASDSNGMASVTDNTAYAAIGAFQASQLGFDGTIDEVRFSRSARSSNWISTQYENQNDPSNFISLGAETSPSASGDWAGYVNYITEWDGINWAMTQPFNGYTTVVTDEGKQYTYNGSSWVLGTNVSAHNDTTGKQGGTTDEYYHLEQSEHTELTQWMNTAILSSDGSIDLGTGSIETAGHISEVTDIDSSGCITAKHVVAYGNGTHPSIAGGYIELYMLGSTCRILPYTGSAYLDLAMGDWNGGDPNLMLKKGGKVGVNEGAPESTLHVGGDIIARKTSGNQLEVQYDDSNKLSVAVDILGDTVITSSGGDIDFDDENLTTTGTLSIGDVSSNIIPSASGTKDIGSVTLAFASGYMDKVFLAEDPTDDMQAVTKQYVDAGTGASDVFLKIDQTAGQTVVNGQPAFASGVKLGNNSSAQQEVFRILDGTSEENQPVFQWRPSYESSSFGGFSFYSPGSDADVALPCIGNATVAVAAFTTAPDKDSIFVLYDNSTGDIDDARSWSIGKRGAESGELKNSLSIFYEDPDAGQVPNFYMTRYGKTVWNGYAIGEDDADEYLDIKTYAVAQQTHIGSWTAQKTMVYDLIGSPGPNYFIDLNRNGYRKFSIGEYGDVAASGSIRADGDLTVEASGIFQNISVLGVDASGDIQSSDRVLGGYDSRFGDSDTHGYRVEKKTIGVYGDYPMLAAYSEGEVAGNNVGLISDYLAIIENKNAQPVVAFVEKDYSDFASFAYTTGDGYITLSNVGGSDPLFRIISMPMDLKSNGNNGSTVDPLRMRYKSIGDGDVGDAIRTVFYHKSDKGLFGTDYVAGYTKVVQTDITGDDECADYIIGGSASGYVSDWFKFTGQGRMLAASGVMTIGGYGKTNNENLLLDFETTPQTVEVSSTTGVTDIDYGAINLTTTGDLSGAYITSDGTFICSNYTGGLYNPSLTALVGAGGAWDVFHLHDDAYGGAFESKLVFDVIGGVMALEVGGNNVWTVSATGEVFQFGYDTDVALFFSSSGTNTGIIIWYEDEDYFLISDTTQLNTNRQLQFRDTGIYINSNDDGHLDLTADVSIDMNGAVINTSTILTATGPTDNLDVSGVNIVWIDTGDNNVTLGGMVNGIAGQILHVVIKDNSNSTVLEHAEGTGNQDIYLSAGTDETRVAKYGGWVLVCDGSNWYECENGVN